MSDPKHKASGVVFTLLVLVGVAMVILAAVNHIVDQNVMVKDERDGELTMRQLRVGELVHAGQYVPPSEPKDRGNPRKDFSRLPLLYWHPQGPVGMVLAKYRWLQGSANTWPGDVRLPTSLVGLGALPGPLPMGPLAAAWSEPPVAALPLKAGALAGYAHPFQIVDFYEPQARILDLSQPKEGTPVFTFVADARSRGALVRVFEGKERDLLSGQAPERFYRAVFVDTVRGELEDIAEDLLTKEGMRQLMATVADDGVLAYHVSHRNVNLAPVVMDVAQSLKLHTRFALDTADLGKGHVATEWIVVARRPEALRGLDAQGGGNVRWSARVGDGAHIWTDAGPNDRESLKQRK